jgi:hypothetical protein
MTTNDNKINRAGETTADETQGILRRIGDALRGNKVPAGRSFLNEAIDGKLAEKHISVRAPWAEPTPEELEAAAQKAQPPGQAGFAGGVQGVETPAGEDLNESIRRQVGL